MADEGLAPSDAASGKLSEFIGVSISILPKADYIALFENRVEHLL